MRGQQQIRVLAVLVLCACPAMVRAAPATAAVVAEVQMALDRGDAKAAAALAEGGLKERDISALERARLQLYHGLAQELLGVSDAAMRDLSAALASGVLPAGERAQALLQRGFLHDGQGELAAAAADYTEVINLGGEGLANALNNRANVFRRQNRFTAARRDYEAAISARGKAQYSWYGLGQIAEAEGEVLAARGFYAKAVAADAGYLPAVQRLNALGGPPEGAIADSKPPISLKPPPPAAPPSPAPKFTPAPSAPVAPVVTVAPVASAGPPADAPIVLRPPRPKNLVVASNPRPAEALASGATLRPSMDRSVSAQGQVQLGAWRSEAEARDGWQKARMRAGAQLGGVEPHVIAADIPGKGRYYRLRVSPSAGVSPGQFCEGLTAQGVACFPARD